MRMVAALVHHLLGTELELLASELGCSERRGPRDQLHISNDIQTL